MESVNGTRTSVVLIVVLLFLVLGAGTVAGQSAAPGGDGGETIRVTGWAAVVTLLLGTVVVMASVELLIHALVRTARGFGVSAFLMAVVFSGWEFDNVAVGVFTGFAELQHVAFGLAIGNAVSIFGLTLAVGILAFPFTVEVPADYLVLTIGAPILLVPVILFGRLTPALSVLYVLAYVVLFAYIVSRERDRDRTFMRSDEVREVLTVADGEGEATWNLPVPVRDLAQSDWFWPGMLPLAVVGIVAGAEGSAAGVEGIISTWHLSGTFVGITLITILYTLDDLLLVLEPLRMGREDVAVGGIIGSLLFFVTANVGIVGLLGTIHFQWQMVFVHLPTLLGFAALSTYLLWRGTLTRGHGAILLGLYVLYLVVNLRFFATLPVGG